MLHRLLLLSLLLVCHTASLAQKWEPYNELGDFYPSVAIAFMNMTGGDDDPTDLGDPNGIMGISLQTTQPNTRITLEMTCSGGLKLFDRAFVSVTAPQAGESYTIAPVVPYNTMLLVGIKQVQPVFITYRVSINGRKQADRTERLLVQPINICPFGITDEEDNYTPLDFMFAAYVNEDHPQIEQILQTALRKKYVDAFIGYQGEKLDVYRQVMAIWRVLQERGIRYSNVTTVVADRENVASQHVRLIGESLNNTQANCVDGSVLFASILRKIGIEPILVLVPGHMFVGFDLDGDSQKQAYLETTMLGTKPGEFEVKNTPLARSLLGTDGDEDLFSIFKETNSKTDIERFIAAIQAGGESYAENKKGIQQGGDDYAKLRVSEARQLGILPIMSVEAPVMGIKN